MSKRMHQSDSDSSDESQSGASNTQTGRPKYKDYLEPESSSSLPRRTRQTRQRQSSVAVQEELVTLSDAEQVSGAEGVAVLEEHDDDAQMFSGDEGVAVPEDLATLSDSQMSSGDEDVPAPDNTTHLDAEVLSSDTTHSDAEVLSDYQDSSDDDDADAAAATHSEDSDVDVVGGGRFGTEPDMDSVLDSAGTTTRAEAILMIMCHAARHNITGTELVDLLKLVNTLFGKDVVPSSKYSFNKIFRNEEIMEFHFYCNNCRANMGTTQEIREKNLTHCAECQEAVDISTLNNARFFINVPVAPQIQRILENPEVQKELGYRRDRPCSGDISDIYDGYLYKQLSGTGQILSDMNNFSYAFNSDGSPLFKSSKFSIWPIQLHLNELPPKMRFKQVVLAGLWFGPSEPNMQVFLKPFVDQSKMLVSKGVDWEKNGTLVNSKVVGLCCCVDSKARPTMQNTTQFNGYFGCGFCLHPGKSVGRQVKYPVCEEEYSDRDAAGMLSDMELAFVEQRTVRGVKGPSPLINMPHFDIVWGFVPDYMHAVLLGVIKQLTELMLHGTNEPYYIGSPANLRVIEHRILSIQPPHLISRLPRSLKECSFWKASEWRAWLLYYSLPCLEGVLEDRFVNHLGLLVSAVYLLLKENLTFEEVNKADVMLLEFCVRFQAYYSESAMTFNMHLLTHLAKSVKMWGPLWAHSAFVFETGNGNLLKMVHGTKGVALQIVNRFLLLRAVPHFISHHVVSDRVLTFCRQMMEYSKVQKFVRYQDTTVVLDSGKTKRITQNERNAFLCASIEPPNEILLHNRMVHKGLAFTSKTYLRAKRRNDSCVTLTDGSVGEIEQIISYNNEAETKIGLLFKAFDRPTPSFKLPSAHGFVSHISCVTEGTSPVQFVPVENLDQKCLFLKPANKVYVCIFPNQYERD